MNRSVTFVQVLSVWLAVVASGWASETSIGQAKTIAEIEKLGGKVTVDENSPDRSVKSVDLAGSRVTDAGLEHLIKGLTHLQSLSLMDTQVTDAGLVHLKGLTKLRSLFLWTNVTDAGLVHLKGLTHLEHLGLHETRVTDAGLVHLKGLTHLEHLFLHESKVTDAGLVHLKGLTQLQGLDLSDTQVTDTGLDHLKGLLSLRVLILWGTKVTHAGVNKFQLALPNCLILYGDPQRKSPLWNELARLTSSEMTVELHEDGRADPTVR